MSGAALITLLALAGPEGSEDAVEPTPRIDEAASTEPEPEPALEPEPEPALEPEPAPQPQPSTFEGPVAASELEGEGGPPYYSEEDIDALRARYELPPDPRIEPRKPKWRCLIPDPACGFGVEISATSAYAYRTRQGNIAVEGAFFEWNSFRVAYDLWFNFPAHVQTVGTYKYTRLTIGPKIGIVASDNKDLWANMGVALRYWFGTGKWAPALEFTSAMSFKFAGDDDGLLKTDRSPVGISADIGLNIGGWGAIIVGGQYDSPLAREEIPEKFRVSAAGQVFVGFRGNILWGGPAVAAVTTHAVGTRLVTNQP